MHAEPDDHMPKPLMAGTTLNQTMGELLLEFERKDADARFSRWAGAAEGFERVLGHFVPPFQRPPVWTRGQNVAFLENAWRGVHLGTIVVNAHPGTGRETGLRDRLDRLIIDGQQRLRAVQSYLSDVFPVFGRTWSQLSERDRWRFEDIQFAKTVVSEKDETLLRNLYDCLNFAGTAHADDQRATTAPSAEPGLVKTYRGFADQHVADLTQNADGTWKVIVASAADGDGRHDLLGTVPTEADALALFRALRDRGVLPSFQRRPDAHQGASHAA